jgi:hypothetical protein
MFMLWAHELPQEVIASLSAVPSKLERVTLPVERSDYGPLMRRVESGLLRELRLTKQHQYFPKENDPVQTVISKTHPLIRLTAALDLAIFYKIALTGNECHVLDLHACLLAEEMCHVTRALVDEVRLLEVKLEMEYWSDSTLETALMLPTTRLELEQTGAAIESACDKSTHPKLRKLTLKNFCICDDLSTFLSPTSRIEDICLVDCGVSDANATKKVVHDDVHGRRYELENCSELEK